MTQHESNFSFKQIEVDEVYQILDLLNTSKALRPDRIPARLLKDSKDVITSYLTHIFNVSFKTSTFHLSWKEARVSPIYKSENNVKITDRFLC